MDSTKKLSKISGIFRRGMTPSIVDALNSAGIIDLQIATARSLMLKEKKRLFGIGSEMVIVENPADILSFLVPFEQEQAVMNLIANRSGMGTQSRGTIFSEQVSLVRFHDLCQENIADSIEEENTHAMHSKLTGICCIVQRGEGNLVARVALDTGTCVPGITFGHGTGVRDKLGLLRIAIPAEKEVINFIASTHDADAVMDLMIDAGKLDQPGKGFIYLYPIGRGIANTKVTHGMPKHAASIERIITALDEIKGGTRWRRRTVADEGNSKHSKTFFGNLTKLIFTCNEGRGENLVRAAMDVGAAGATIVKLKHHCPKDSRLSKISPAREECNMVVGEDQVSDIVDTIEKAGGFDDDTHGQALVRPIPKACTYFGG